MSDTRFQLDGQPIPYQEGETLLQAAERAGATIPHLCYEPDLPPGGHCRVCVVKVDGRFRAACTWPASQGLTVENATSELLELRRSLVEMLFMEGVHQCPSCERSGQCRLQATAYQLSLTHLTGPSLRSGRERDASHPELFLERDRCILCGLCVRASRGPDQKGVFGFEGRGHLTQIAVDCPGGLVGTSASPEDRAVEVCPTGCLAPKGRGFSVPVGARRFDLHPLPQAGPLGQPRPTRREALPDA